MLRGTAVAKANKKPVAITHLRLDSELAGLNQVTAILRQQREEKALPRKVKKTAEARVGEATKRSSRWQAALRRVTKELSAAKTNERRQKLQAKIERYERLIVKNDAKRAKYAPIAALAQKRPIIVAPPNLIGTAKRIKQINAFLGSNENALAIAKLRGSPMALLIEKASAKGEELMAAQEIELAFMAISGALMFKPLSMERTSRGQYPDWPQRTCQAVAQYQKWANHWSARRKANMDYTMECIIAAVIDQRPIRSIAADLGFHHARIEKAVIGGLRDYAARAGWVDGKVAREWMDAAERTFNRRMAA